MHHVHTQIGQQFGCRALDILLHLYYVTAQMTMSSRPYQSEAQLLIAWLKLKQNNNQQQCINSHLMI